MKRSAPLVLAAFALLLLVVALAPRVARAQDASPGPALPTAPGAQKVDEGGTTQAPASVPGAPGLSPLEPYLVTWLLPISGIVCAVIGTAVDRRLRAS